MKTSPTGGDSPAAILVQDLRAWAKYQPFSFTGRHPANLESGITCGERAGQGNVVGDCHPLPSAPVAPNPERPPWGTSPAPPGQGCPSARCGEGVGMAWTTLLLAARSRPGEALTPPCPPPSEALLRAVLCQGREGFLLSHLPTSTSGQSWSMAEQRARVKWERQGAEGACQQHAARSSPVPHSLKNGQAPKQARGASERSMQGTETARGQTVLHSYNRHKAIRVMGEEAHPDRRDVHCLHQCD